MKKLKRLLQRIWSDIRTRRVYWATAVAVLIATILIEPYVDARLQLADARDWLFEHLIQSVTNPATSRDVRLVAIRDDEFWDGALQHRVPTNRTYLASLVRALEAVEASVIALDFDVRLPDPKARISVGEYSAISKDDSYRDETDDLIRAIDVVAQSRKVVLSKTIAGDVDGPFDLLNDVYQVYGICTNLKANGQWENPGTPDFPLTPTAQSNISCGYIALMTNRAMVPPPAIIKGSDKLLNSFPYEIARAWSPDLGPGSRSRRYFASYIESTADPEFGTAISAHDLVSNPQSVRGALQGHPVIIGAAWHTLSKGGGYLIDLHNSPIGRVSGAVIHQNLAEAILSRRVFPGLSDGTLLGLELLVGLAAGVFFGAFTAWWKRLLAVAASMLILFLLQWIMLQLFATFLDAFVPVLGLGLHALADRLIGHKEVSEGDNKEGPAAVTAH